MLFPIGQNWPLHIRKMIAISTAVFLIFKNHNNNCNNGCSINVIVMENIKMIVILWNSQLTRKSFSKYFYRGRN